jgi:hypothetical protein
MNRHPGRHILPWLILAKTLYIVGILVSVALWPDMDETFYGVQRWPRVGESTFGSHFATWDAAHYLYLSEVGYSREVHSCAFYPLWPLLIRFFSILTGGSHLIAGMVLGNVLSLMAWCIFYKVTARRFGETVGLWALVLLAIFPGSVFYQFIYTEPLFFLLVMLLWSGLEESRYGTAFVAATLLPLSRAVGVFSVLPIAWHCLMRSHWIWPERYRWFYAERNRVKSSLGALSMDVSWQRYSLIAAPPLGLGLYFALMWLWTGNPFEGMEAQKHWGVHSITNLVDIPKFVVGFFSPTDLHTFKGSVFDRCMFVLLLYLVPCVWRLGKDLLAWTYVLGVLPAMSGTFTSFTRFESTVFPLFIALAVVLTQEKRRWALACVVATSTALHVLLLWRFVNFRWAG